jgi:inner membrane protein
MAGAVMAKAGLERYTPLAMPTLVIGANLPDVDIATRVMGPLAYLQYHRGITHSIVGVIGLSILLAAGMLLLDRTVWRRIARTWEPARFHRLFLVSLMGVASHPLLDFTNSYGVRPFLPWDGRWVYGDIVVVIDPWLWLILGGALFVLTSQTRPGKVGWGVLGTFMTALVLSGHRTLVAQGHAPAVGWVWPVLVVGLIGARWWGVQRYGSKVAVGALVAVVLYWAGLWAAHGVALEQVKAGSQAAVPDQPTVKHAALAFPATPLVWEAFFETPEAVYIGRVSLGPAPGPEWPLQQFPKRLDDPLVRRAFGTCAGATMQAFSRFLFAEVDQAENGPSVILRDVRYQRRRKSGFAVVVVPLNERQQTGCP